MPRIHSQAKQKNKPFKGKSKGKDKGNRIASTKTKSISKSIKSSAKRVKIHKVELVKQRKMRKIVEVEGLARKNQYLDVTTKSKITEKMKEQDEIKIVLLLPCNAEADPIALLTQLYTILNNPTNDLKVSSIQSTPGLQSFSSLLVSPVAGKSCLRSRFQIIAPSAIRSIPQLMDLCKLSDIICPILSCLSTNCQLMSLNPFQQAKAFDQTGYTILNMIRSLGVPTTVGVVQHLQKHEKKQHDRLERLFRRFMNSQLGEQAKVVTILNDQDRGKLVRTLDTVHVNPQPWKAQRGYMLVENLKKENNMIVLEGYLKGNCINANQLVHLTGFDDYQIQSIEIKQSPIKPVRNNKKKTGIDIQEDESIVQHSTVPQKLFAFASTSTGPAMGENDLLSALQGLKIQTQQKLVMPQVQSQNDYQDMSDQQGDLSSQQFDQQLMGDKDQQRQKRIQLQMRKDDQMEFQDQVQYTADQLLREKYRNYQGLKNFKTSQWNHLENLPEQYDRIYTFKHYAKTQHTVIAENIAKGFAYPGFYVSITIRGLENSVDALQKHLSQGPLIASFLLKHQRKMTMLHAKVKRNAFYPLNDVQIKSNQTYMISMGFRKFYIKPIFSRCMNGTQKTKFTRVIKQDYQSHFLCSFYYYNYFPPAPFSVYRVNPLNLTQVQPCSLLLGQLSSCNPLHIILQRIILCGYPYKINKRKSTIRYMFFHPKDIKFFKPVEVRTKMGLRGRIQESLGTHGLMKVMFSDQIKHNDTVCMSLYNRVYPKAEF